MNSRVIDLDECTEYRQALSARPGLLMCGLPLLISLLVTAALAFAALAQVGVVVRVRGEIRPAVDPTEVFNLVSPKTFSTGAGSKVAEVCCTRGQRVEKGELLLRFDAEALQNEITHRQSALLSLGKGLEQSEEIERLTRERHETALARARAELKEAEDDLRTAKDRRESEIRSAQLDVKFAQDNVQLLQNLLGRQSASGRELSDATAALRTAEERLIRARLPINTEKTKVLGEAVELVHREYAVRRSELLAQQEARRAELEAARLELANLELDRRYLTVSAPVSGVVTEMRAKVGDVVEPGGFILAVAEHCGLRFDVKVPDQEVVWLKPGMPAQIRLDAYDYQRYGMLPAIVEFIAPDAETRAGKQQDRPAASSYTVRLALDDDKLKLGESRGPLMLGLNGEAAITVRQESILRRLLGSVRHTMVP